MNDGAPGGGSVTQNGGIGHAHTAGNAAPTSVHFALLERDPGFRARLAAVEHATARRLMAAPAKWKVVTIPTVVHVVHHTAAENISDAQVRSQISVLNRDFRKKNPDRSEGSGGLGRSRGGFRHQVPARPRPRGRRPAGPSSGSTTRSSPLPPAAPTPGRRTST